MKSIVVVGLGESARAANLRGLYTIGVNDVAQFHHPQELLILDKPGRFQQSRLDYISCTQANHVWSPHPAWGGITDLPYREIKTRKFTRDLDFDWDGEFLPHFLTSPFAAIGLAYKLGAKEIGLIGVDLREDHHMNSYLNQINHQLHLAWTDLYMRDVRLWNCSRFSLIKSLPYKRLST